MKVLIERTAGLRRCSNRDADDNGLGLVDAQCAVVALLRRPRAVSTSSRSLASAAAGKRQASSGSSRPLQRTGSVTRSRMPRSNNCSASAQQTYVPKKSRPMPINQEAEVTSSANDCSISSRRSSESRPSRSSLLRKVIIGASRRRQTSRACGSVPRCSWWRRAPQLRCRRRSACGKYLAKILVARCTEQIAGEAVLLEAHPVESAPLQ